MALTAGIINCLAAGGELGAGTASPAAAAAGSSMSHRLTTPRPNAGATVNSPPRSGGGGRAGALGKCCDGCAVVS